MLLCAQALEGGWAEAGGTDVVVRFVPGDIMKDAA